MSLFFAINRFAGKSLWLDIFMKYVSLGGIYFYWIIMLYLFFTGNLLVKFYLFKTGVVGLIAVFIAKYLGKRYYFPRPFVKHPVKVLYPHKDDSSFPSDHVTGAVTLALGILGVAKVAGLISLGYAVLIAVARIYAGHHYPRDVLGGILLGAIVYYLAEFFNFL
ncbi:phosphatase PAP2 family protein [Carboxydothermus pertinax]|uniref:Phosphatidic acid phosphatase type 2/haloperoxidase domain-containing protein n=1 Tax=Carboxydothermus pertinax TaxID=870242 RepID=A0A1L8CVD2_9THEO|nr:phosphatase PAP2 family protein [Carboxydothermus pertinax]GAV22870.1 hypothetical protein cpu_13800 [Carboxydothermus pertinax]